MISGSSPTSVDRIVVMYAGRIVETGPTAEVLRRPGASLYRAADPIGVPKLGGGKRELVAIPGLPPAVDDLPPGCAFAPRCLRAQEACKAGEIALEGTDDRAVRCLFPERSRRMTVVLKATNLSKSFPVGRSLFRGATGIVKAVRPTDLIVERGETLGIVGEFGCGKSTLARMLVGLSTPTTGTIEIDGRAFDTNDRRLSSQQIQYVFQDPLSSLNPRKTIRAIMEAPLKSLFRLGRAERAERIAEVFASVNLRPEFLDRYPHEFSGGQAQRIGIARALLARPSIIVLDEPVSALDVSVQAQVLNLLADLRAQYDLTYLFISHDLAVVEAVSDRVAVLYFGKVVEIGPATRIFAHPRHPYTRLLADSAPVVGRPLAVRDVEETELPDPLNPPPGCPFAARCPKVSEICRNAEPALQSTGEAHFAACYHPN